MTQMLGDKRPDIVAAASRMGRRMGGNRELKNLADHLHDGETVRFIAQGTYEDKQGIVALTDLRLVLLFHGIIGQAKEDFPLKLISSVQTKSGFATGEIKVHVSGNNAVISGILKNDLEPLANAVRQGMAEQHAPGGDQSAPSSIGRSGPRPLRGDAENGLPARCWHPLARGVRGQEEGVARPDVASGLMSVRALVSEARCSAGPDG